MTHTVAVESDTCWLLCSNTCWDDTGWERPTWLGAKLRRWQTHSSLCCIRVLLRAV